jgi:hypothetical protein
MGLAHHGDMPARAPQTRSAPAPVGAGGYPPSVRDAALCRLSSAKWWSLAATLTLTGMLAAVTASAFPGKSASPEASVVAGGSW